MTNTIEVPAAQALMYSIERLKESVAWLREIYNEWLIKCNSRSPDAYKLSLRLRILTDAIAMYVTALTNDNRGYSLGSLYGKEFRFVKEFLELEIVKKCQMNRHNRSAHELKSYGNFVSPKEILDSNLESWVNDAEVFLCVIAKGKINH